MSGKVKPRDSGPTPERVGGDETAPSPTPSGRESGRTYSRETHLEAIARNAISIATEVIKTFAEHLRCEEQYDEDADEYDDPICDYLEYASDWLQLLEEDLTIQTDPNAYEDEGEEPEPDDEGDELEFDYFGEADYYDELGCDIADTLIDEGVKEIPVEEIKTRWGLTDEELAKVLDAIHAYYRVVITNNKLKFEV